ncbi:MAG: hypothetical protein WB780_10510 [Candidatus Acidiferrales bacterium]
MTRNVRKTLPGVAGRMLLAYALIFAQGAWAGQGQETTEKNDSPKSAAQQSSQKQPSATTNAKPQSEESQGEAFQSVVKENNSGDGSHEGIKVHGHWTIDVHNPDGSLVSHREFENSLQQGALALAGILGHQSTVGFWDVLLYASPNCGNASDVGCTIVETSSGLSGETDRFTGLVVSLTNSGASLTLTGSFQAPVAMQITAVQTVLNVCPPTTTSTACSQMVGTQGYSFTFANLATPVAVQNGQTIAVTVAISFS